jgi:hypothetical protein
VLVYAVSTVGTTGRTRPERQEAAIFLSQTTGSGQVRMGNNGGREELVS